MQINLDTTPATTVNWLRTFGHTGKYAVKLIEKQKGLLDAVAAAESDEELAKAVAAVKAYIAAFGQ